MKLRLTRRAYNDIVNIDHYISEVQNRPLTAKTALGKIESALQRIEDMPLIGRVSYFPGTRELTISGLPFCIVYRVENETVFSTLHPPGLSGVDHL